MRRALFALGILTVPFLASAHTRWFTTGELIPYTTDEPTTLYLLVCAGIIFLIVIIACLFQRQKLLTFDSLEPKKPHVFERAASTFAMVSGTWFIISGTHLYLFSPNLSTASGIPEILIFIEIIIGMALLLGIGTRMAAIVLGLLWFTVFIYGDWIVAIENIWVISTAAFIALMGNDYFSIISFSVLREKFVPYKRYALSILRIGAGATLMVLGFSEKILAPEYGINFLAEHNWNFMQSFGLPFSDYLFVISAGATEFLFGILFVLGLATRLNAFVVITIFTIPLFILGPLELAGHLPHFAAIILLLLFGNGGHFALFNEPKYK